MSKTIFSIKIEPIIFSRENYTMNQRELTSTDNIVLNLDRALRTLFGKPKTTNRPNPSLNLEEIDLSAKEKDHIARLMRINHTGEVCAQALYQGQAFTAKDKQTKLSMQKSADEEYDHLQWCEERIKELDGRTSLLNPVWYAGSLLIGLSAGVIGDKWSLGFVAETEKQVKEHLEDHINQIPEKDQRTSKILKQMVLDEDQHGKKALEHGAADLPKFLRLAMKVTSKLMTKTVYRI